jgi:hypothetical protein
MVWMLRAGKSLVWFFMGFCMNRASFSVLFASFYLLLYFILCQVNRSAGIAILMFSLSPFVIIWMVYSVLKYGKYNGKPLDAEEFGYKDKNKEELGVF